MFATLQIDGRSKSLVERNDSGLGRQACSNCRKKKVKCSGEKAGCRACRSRDLECVYPDSSVVSTITSGNQPLTETDNVRATTTVNHVSQKRMIPNSMPLSEDINNIDWNALAAETYERSGSLENPWFDFEPANYTDINGYLESLNDAGWFSSSIGPPGDLSLSDASSPSTTDSNPGQCDCMQQIARAIETLELEMSRSSLKNILQLFNTIKGILAVGTTMSRCQSCTADSSVTMIKIILCQKIIASFEHLVYLLSCRYLQLSRRPQGYETPPGYMDIRERALSSARERDEDNELVVFINGHSLDPMDTPCAFVGLVNQQLFVMKHLLGKMRRRVEGNGWHTHLVLIDSVHGRITDQLSKLLNADHKIMPE